MPISGLTENIRMPRLGKIYLGVKVKPEGKREYPKATDYFVWPDGDAPGARYREQLIAEYGEQPTELPIVFAANDLEYVASQYYRCYTKGRGLVCKGDGIDAARMIDKATGFLPNADTKETEMVAMSCDGRQCPEYIGKAGCHEVMCLQFMLPKISGLGVWQIDTGSINSIRNVNSSLQMIRSIYGRIDMVPLTLAIEKLEVVPPGGTKKTVYVLNVQSTDTLVEASIKARKPAYELIAGPVDHEKADRDIAELWPADASDHTQVEMPQDDATRRMTPAEIEAAKASAPIEDEPPLDDEDIFPDDDPPPPPPPPPDPKAPVMPDPNASLQYFMSWLSAHGKKYTPSWFYKTFNYEADDLKDAKRRADAVAEVKDQMQWDN